MSVTIALSVNCYILYVMLKEQKPAFKSILHNVVAEIKATIYEEYVHYILNFRVG